MVRGEMESELVRAGVTGDTAGDTALSAWCVLLESDIGVFFSSSRGELCKTGVDGITLCAP